ncbi:hypothetical protein BCR39DRAFT_555621 [Naematelia encephala]|uniref:sn-1-specific diacylglycerol lipase n=1 Tax=Naematelia encephala TaxID=71784 RepID=A0A1Y2BL23_9TREE|nr:hypothetical protein BCR39DRAFT_555621 [Naematelia encephala]
MEEEKRRGDDGDEIDNSFSPSPSTGSALVQRIPLSDLATIPTLFPAPVANLVTALATSARLSLRVAAFFIEAILETSQYSTRLSLGYTRRVLISAISSARRVYLMSNAAFEGDLMGLMGFTDEINKSTSTSFPSTDGFLQILDRYTNLGIYVIHHTFTMAELFAMSGFYLTANAVQSAHFAAQESVALFDSLFGSNESSRALSSIITMVRRELLEDERFIKKDKGKLTSLTALTKALTAFACLQTATWKRTAERMQMKVLYDCTVTSKLDESYKSATMVLNNLPPPSEQHQRLVQPNEPPPLAGPGPSTIAARDRQRFPPFGPHQEVQDDRQEETRLPQKPTLGLDDLRALDDLLGESDDEEGQESRNAGEHVRRLRRSKRRTRDTFEITDTLTESTVVTHLLEQRSSEVQVRPTDHPRVSSIAMPELQVEDAGDEDVQISVTRQVGPTGVSTLVDGDENEWIEVDQLLDDDLRDENGSVIPSIPNGGSSVASQAYSDALEHPSASSERIQLVFKTMTNKLLQRKRTFRRVRAEDTSDGGGRDIGTLQGKRSASRLGSRPDVRKVDWGKKPRSPSVSSSGNGTPSKTHRVVVRQTDSPPPTLESPRKSESQFGKAVSRARSALSIGSRQNSRETSPHRSNTPTPPSTPPPASQESKPNTREAFRTGVRAPPPSPMASKPAPRPSSNSYRDRENHRNRPSLTAVQETVHSSQSRIQAASAQRPEQADETPASLFPHDSLIRNIHRFMRYSSAAYGQNFLRIFGLGNSDYNFSSTARHHANSWAFAQHTNIPIDSLLLSSYTEQTPALPRSKAPPLVHYIAVEHKLQAVVLTCRGTLGLSDVLIDLTCEYRSIHVEGGDPDGDYYVHSGMYQSALGLTAKQSTVHQTLVDTLVKYPNYGLVVTGHSLGGGVAALLAIACSTPAAMFLKENAAREQPISHPPITTPFVTSFTSGLPAGRPIHSYAYGPPAITSPALAKYARGLITSVVQNSDVVPCISLGTLRDLRNIALTLYEEGNVAEEIVGRVVGIYQSKLPFQNSQAPSVTGNSRFSSSPSALQSPSTPGDEEVLNDWMVSLIKTMRADMDSDKLYPPGVVYILEYFDVFVTTEATDEERRRGAKATHHKQAHRVILRQCDSVEERFREPLFSKTMLNDHLPSHYERSTQLLYDGMGCGKM